MTDFRDIPNAVFVFGSNLAGIHGAGAAKEAHVHWGAEWGVAEGRTGRAYALPTKVESVRNTRPMEDIKESMRKFVECARENPDKVFLVTPVGTGFAGLAANQIVDMLVNAGGPTRNMLFTASWLNPEVF